MLTYKVEPKGAVSPGISTCQGCMIDVIFRNALDVLGEDTVLVVPPGCAAQFSGCGPEASVTVAGIQGNLENSAAIASGIANGYKHQGNDHTTICVIAGDGGTVDIGLQSLSGAMERNENILYICYDNEAYMNTGVQGSSSTPLAASTTTTPAGKPVNSKDLFRICMAHNIPYAATASIANIPDFRRKVQKAKDIRGCRVIHIMSPCPTGWGYKSAKTVEVAREAINSGAWLLLEYENGRLTISKKPTALGQVESYVRMQKRFKGASDEAIAALSAHVCERYTYMEKLTQIMA
ncbi:MAG: pyruvate synthase subunit beta [Lachnospiraceae bacterium]|nr:pyruvate synthase subunit beta [Lachnospiraceae bacterium]